MKILGYTDLVDKMKFDPGDILELLKRREDQDKLYVYENHMLDSSHCGDANVVVVGPNRTFKEPPPRFGDVPSRIQELVGELDIEDFVKNTKKSD